MKWLAVTAIGAMLAFGAPNAAEAQRQDGLVNVNVGDVTVLENVGVGVAAQVVAQVCPNVQVGQVAVLATQVVQAGQESETICEAELEGEQGPITIEPGGNGGGGNQGAPRQSGLVNVNVGDVTVLENVAVGVAAQAVAQVCPNVQVGQVAVLASQAVQAGQESEVICEAQLEGEQGPITIAPGGGGGNEGRR